MRIPAGIVRRKNLCRSHGNYPGISPTTRQKNPTSPALDGKSLGKSGNALERKPRWITRTLSDAARECGFWDGVYLCYEEDCQAYVVLRELLDQDRQNVPSWVKDAAAFERDIDRSLQRYNPGYWQARRERRMIHPRPRQRRRRSACAR